jgi:membrane protease YdiL (CAAX protease family)
MTKVLTFLRKKPLLTLIIAQLGGVGGIKLMDPDDIFAAGVFRYILAFAMCMFLYLISGEKTFKSSEKTTGYILKYSLGVIVFAGILAVLAAVVAVYQKAPLVDGWYIQIISLAFVCLGVGLFEELAFRAIICDGFIYAFRDKKWVFAVSAILGSLFFGYVHVMGADISDSLLLTSAITKTLSAGLWGVCLVILYWKTRNVWGCAIAHAIYDFLPLLCNTIFVMENDNIGTGYVQTGFAGKTAIVFYSLESVVLVIILIVLWKKVVKTINFEEMRSNW